MAVENVGDDERLYRRVLKSHAPASSGGGIRISSQAFSDRERKISVDRALLCANDPNYTKKNETDGVTYLVAKEVREINDLFLLDAKGKQVKKEVVTVDPDPIQDDPELGNNPAHAIIYATPDFDNRGVFNRLIEKLAIIAQKNGWLITPLQEV